MNELEKRILFLKKVELFKGLKEEELKRIAEVLKERLYPPESIIVREESPGDSMFIIVSGSVDVKKKEPFLGLESKIASLGPSDCFGEMALLTGKPRSATVVTKEPTIVLILEKDAFENILLLFPSISLSLNRVMAERLEVTSTQRGLNIIPLSKIKIEKEILSLLPKRIILSYKVLPVGLSSNTLTVGMVNPHDLFAFDEIRKHLKMKALAIEPAIILEEDFKRFMEIDYPRILSEEEIEQFSKEKFLEERQKEDLLKYEEEEDQGVTDLAKEAEDAPIIKLANNIIALALKNGASDIHIEPMERFLRVRFRIDGLLREEMRLPKKVQLPLVSRIKILSRLDITERRLPQDGRIKIRLSEKSVDLRVSTVPTKFGEKVVIRILDRSETLLSLENIVPYKDTLEIIREMIRKPYGILFVTGPTGSGKTTTLYSILKELNSSEVNIATVEDPIEYDLSGINQVQVNPEIGLDFPKVLRAFLRQDPDIILVGETRDRETAKIAIEAALTGHLVFTTLHANDAPSSFVRLYEMGIEPFLVSTSVIGVIAQRLVRRICPSCRESYIPSDAILRYFGLEEKKEFFRAKGCKSCNLTGYRGRIALFEVLKVNEPLRKLIAEGADVDVIRREAQKNGMRTLKDYAGILLEDGLTTVEEVLRTIEIQN